MRCCPEGPGREQAVLDSHLDTKPSWVVAKMLESTARPSNDQNMVNTLVQSLPWLHILAQLTTCSVRRIRQTRVAS